MSNRKQLQTELKVGIFVTIGVGLTMLAILVLGSTENLLVRENVYKIHFNTVDGLITGAKVTLGGIAVGTIKAIELDRATRQIEVSAGVESKYADLIRKDSIAQVATQGLLGDKFIAISAGAADQPALPPGSEIPIQAPKDLTQFLSKGDQLMASLTSLAGSLDRVVKSLEANNRSTKLFEGLATSAQNVSSASEKLSHQLEGDHLRGTLKSLQSILDKIDKGKGTLGAIINDPELYDDAKALIGGANRSRIVRNLLRQTIKEGQQPEK